MTTKIPTGVTPSVVRVTTPATPSVKAADAKPADKAPAPKPGFSTQDAFAPRVANKLAEGRFVTNGVADDTIGRAKVGGVADDTIGRAKVGGVADDTIGRAKVGGVADDTIGRKNAGGVADDTIGRKNAGGVADDTIGRKNAGGVADDTIGNQNRALAMTATTPEFDPVRDALVGPDNDPNRMALRDALFKKLETPSWAVTGSAAKQRITAALGSLGSAGWLQLNTVMTHLGDAGLKLLGAAAEKTPQLFTQKDSKGGTLLSNLAQLATQPLNAKLAKDTKTEDVLTSTLRDIVNPNRIDQGDAPTCTVTSMQFELVADEPVEYARLMTGLTGPEGKATMRGGGVLETGTNDAQALDGRAVSQAIFQSSCMEFANGKAMEFDPVAGKSTNQVTGAEQRGLKPLQQTTMLRNLFGVRYSTQTFYDPKQGAKALETLRGFDARGSQNRPVILDIDQGAINHAVTLEKVAGGRVQFRDPYGVLRSMPEELFSKYVVAMHVPQSGDNAVV